VTALLRHEWFPGVGYLTSQQYYHAERSQDGLSQMVSFSEFQKHLAILEHRNQRLKLRKLSLHADLIRQRSQSSGLPFLYIMQADFVLFIRDCLDCRRYQRRQHWYPVTLLYAGHQYSPFEVFARCVSARYFDNIKGMFEITGKEDLIWLAEAYKKGELQIPNWEGDSFNPFFLMNLDKLATLP